MSPPRRERPDACVQIDAATRANLELTRTIGGDRAGSLLSVIDRTLTPAGGRLLAERLAGPLTDPAAIDARLDSVAWVVDDPVLRAGVRDVLKRARALSRALARLTLQRGGPRDLAALRDGLAAGRAVAGLLGGAPLLPGEIAQAVNVLG